MIQTDLSIYEDNFMLKMRLFIVKMNRKLSEQEQLGRVFQKEIKSLIKHAKVQVIDGVKCRLQVGRESDGNGSYIITVMCIENTKTRLPKIGYLMYLILNCKSTGSEIKYKSIKSGFEKQYSLDQINEALYTVRSSL